ncbi:MULTISPECIES: TolC family protein [unclassified Lentimicrobium]|uniref:TolC family protein n=1 Tax=unclassified Lentimicrobium TaxID=2677434 RepID=UPI001556266D|nr:MULTISPECIES: TolC family protein [unclassified Lentimicrobium]NPD46894.1 TolC family protein [Lentimicrobium sp. S6]NPD83852.1 TolC family protein [Lentimicrobium sp. L6]
MRILKYISVVLLLAFASQMSAQESSPLTLEEAVTIALEKNFDIQISNKNVESAEVNNTWGAAGMFPSVDVGISQTNRFDNSESMSSDERDDVLRSGVQPYVQVRWMLFNGLNVYIKKDKLELVQQLSEGNAAVVVESKIQAVVLAYYQSLLNREKLKTIERVKKLSRDRFNYVQTKKQFGSAVSYDVLQAKNSYLSDSTNYLLQSLELKKSQLNLNLLMGVEKENVYELTSVFEPTIEDYKYFDLEDKMFSSNKTLQNQYINMEILQKDVASAKASVWPTLNLNSGTDYASNYVRYSGADPNSSYSYDFYVNFSLNFNLYDGGRTRRLIKQSIIQSDIGNIQESQIKQTLSNGLLTVYEMYQIRKQLLSVADVGLETAQLNLDLSTEKFKNGSINSFNFRDVQIIFINSEFSRLEAVYNLINTHTELLRATGGIISEFE